MLYNVVWISAIQQCESVIALCNPSFMSLPPAIPPFLSSRSSLNTGLSSRVIQGLCASYPFYIWWCIYVNAALSVHPTPSFPHCVHRSAPYLRIFVPALQLFSSTCCAFKEFVMRKLASIAQVSAEWRSKGSMQKSRVGDWTGLLPKGTVNI